MRKGNYLEKSNFTAMAEKLLHQHLRGGISILVNNMIFTLLQNAISQVLNASFSIKWRIDIKEIHAF